MVDKWFFVARITSSSARIIQQMDWENGKKVHKGKYEIIRRIDTGGFGQTYEAIDLTPGDSPQRVAIKTIRKKYLYDDNGTYDDLQVKFYNREGRALMQCQHPYIVLFKDFFEEKVELSCPKSQKPREIIVRAIVMEYIDGKKLSSYIDDKNGMNEEEAISFIRKIALALDYVHSQGFVHRDMSPGNILVRLNNEPVLIDFGTALQYKRSGVVVSETMYKPNNYSPPERKIRGSNIQPSLDIYGLAATLYACVVNDNPPAAEGRREGDLEERIPAAISDRLRRALIAGMSLKSEERPATVMEWLKLLEGSDSVFKLSLNTIKKTINDFFPQLNSKATTVSRRENNHLSIPKTTKINNQSPSSNESNPEGSNIIRRKLLLLLACGGGATIPLIISRIRNPASQNPTFVNSETIQFTTIKLDSKGNIASQVESKALIYKENLGEGIIITMVKILAGSFVMGSSSEEKTLYASPQHQVTLKEFYMAQTEITQAQYQKIMNSNPSSFQNSNYPVENISWKDAKKFCQQLSKFSGKQYSLPTESQWEYACRAGTTTPFYFGDIITSGTAKYNIKISESTDSTKTVEVGKFPPNAFGLYDMHGNVSEWCEDNWHEDYQGAPTDESSWTAQNAHKNSRIIRGGSMVKNKLDCRSASREWWPADAKRIDIGFRIVLIKTL